MTAIAKVAFFLLGACLLVSMAGLEFCSFLIILLWLLAYRQKRESLHYLSGTLRPLVALMLFTLLSLAFNEHSKLILPTIGWFRWILFFVASSYLLRFIPDTRRTLFIGLYTGFTIGFANSLLQFFTHYDWIRSRYIPYYADMTKQITRVTGFFNLPTTYGYILAMFLMIPLFLFFLESQRKNRWVHAGIFLLALFNLVLTYTRGAWISALAGVLLFFFFTYRKYVLPFLLSLVALIMLFVVVDSGFRERVTSVTNPSYYSNMQRLELWKANLAIFWDNPFFGVGINQNDNIVEQYHLMLGHEESFSSHAHNTYLQFLAGTGFLGLTAYLLFLSALFAIGFRSFRNTTDDLRILIGGGLAILFNFLVCSLFDCNFGDSEVRYSFLTYMALLVSYTSLHATQEDARFSNKSEPHPGHTSTKSFFQSMLARQK